MNDLEKIRKTVASAEKTAHETENIWQLRYVLDVAHLISQLDSYGRAISNLERQVEEAPARVQREEMMTTRIRLSDLLTAHGGTGTAQSSLLQDLREWFHELKDR